MAQIACRACDKMMDKGTIKCPNCGTLRKKRKINVKQGAILLVVALVSYSIWAIFSPASAPKMAMVEENPVLWTTTKSFDKLSGGKKTVAELKSLNEFNFEYPYQGGSYGVLSIIKHPRFGNNVKFTVSRGQIMCSNFDGCTVTLTFDDAPPVKVNAFQPDVHPAENLMLNSYDMLVPQILASKKLRIEVEFYQAGSRVFDFDTHGLKWE